MIDAIKLPGLRNGEFSQFILDFLAFVSKGNPQTLRVMEEYNALLEKSGKIEGLFKQPQGSVITDELIGIDQRRDDAFTGYSFIVTGYTYSSDPVKKAAALLLKNHFSGYGKAITNDNFQSETATLRNIVKDLDDKPELVNAVSALGLAEWKEEVKTGNTLFGDIYLKRAEETGNNTEDSLRDLRLLTNQTYYELRDRLNSFLVIERGAEPYATVVRNCNGLVTYYNNLLAKRTSNPDEPAPIVPVTPTTPIA